MISRLSLAARVASLSVCCLALGSCDTSNAIIPDASSTSTTPEVESVDTTAPPIAMTDIPKEVRCPRLQIRRDTGDVYEDILRCVPGWAVGIPKRVTDKWTGETSSEGEWVLKHTKEGWKTVGVCHIYHPIYSTGVWCSEIDGDDVDITLLPPMNVQCALWDAASWEENIKETGCPVSADS